MIDELRYNFDLIKDEIKQIKEDSLNKFDEQERQERENLNNLKKEIEALRNEINTIKQNNIKQTREENENIKNVINIIKDEVQILKENQSKKVDSEDFIETRSNLQMHQQKDKKEKDSIQEELLNIKQIVKKN